MPRCLHVMDSSSRRPTPPWLVTLRASPGLMADGPLDLLVVWNWAGQAQASRKLQLSWVMAPWAQTPHAPSLPPATMTSGSCWQVGPWDVGTTM